MNLPLRFVASLASLGVVWAATSVAIGIYKHDVGALVGFGLWSIPFLAAGWMVFGIPAILVSMRIRSTALLAFILGFGGTVAGGLMMLAPAAFVRWKSPQTHYVPFAWSELETWPALGAAMGAATSLLYTWVLSLKLSDEK